MAKTRSYLAIPPGETIKEILESRGMSQKAFAARMDMSEKHISKLINGDVRLTYEVAVRLEIVLGPSAGFWNRLEAAYREQLMQDEYRKQSKEEEELVERFPYKELVKVGWLPKSRDNGEKTENLRRFFETFNLCSINKELIAQTVGRKIDLTEIRDLELVSFVQKAKLIARDMEVNQLKVKKLIKAVPEIKAQSTFKSKAFKENIKEILLKCGVILLFLPNINDNYPIHATFYDGNKVIIAFSEGMENMDLFWRELFHDIGLVILGYIKKYGSLTDEENETAYNWSDNTLIDYAVFDEYKSKNDYSEKSIIMLSGELNIAPKIITERLQRERLLDYSVLMNMSEKK